MSDLPNAEHQSPACGVCGSETCYSDESFICEDCGLRFDENTLAAEFIDPDADPCGEPCDNNWHGDHKINPGEGYDCGTCKLPLGHPSKFHWTDCQWKRIDAA